VPEAILNGMAFARAVAKRVGRATITVLPGGHGFFLERADLFHRAVLRFVRSC
jgi:pimeloyl-ACP methyl ester carboxylesterase